MEATKNIVNWLLQGDISIQYQTYRDLLDENRPELQRRILTEGWGADFLNLRNKALGKRLLPTQMDLHPLHST